jgi:hypothetical protein
VKASLVPSGDQSAPNSSTRPVFVMFSGPEPSAFITKISELLLYLE